MVISLVLLVVSIYLCINPVLFRHTGIYRYNHSLRPILIAVNEDSDLVLCYKFSIASVKLSQCLLPLRVRVQVRVCNLYSMRGEGKAYILRDVDLLSAYYESGIVNCPPCFSPYIANSTYLKCFTRVLEEKTIASKELRHGISVFSVPAILVTSIPTTYSSGHHVFLDYKPRYVVVVLVKLDGNVEILLNETYNMKASELVNYILKEYRWVLERYELIRAHFIGQELLKPVLDQLIEAYEKPNAEIQVTVVHESIVNPVILLTISLATTIILIILVHHSYRVSV